LAADVKAGIQTRGLKPQLSFSELHKILERVIVANIIIMLPHIILNTSLRARHDVSNLSSQLHRRQSDPGQTHKTLFEK
jgi:hypothetical protein